MQNMRIVKIILFALLLFYFSNSFGQYKRGLSDITFSVINNQFGLPFVQFRPIHIGGEVGVKLLENNKTNTAQSVSAQLGFFNHHLIANAPYLKINYDFQVKIKQIIGINGYAALGYVHTFYPGNGYSFNASTGSYEKIQLNQAFLLSNVGFGISYIKPNRIKPFLKYELMMAGFNIDQLFTNFHIGITMKLNNL
jgi:hypothetical protein